MTSGTLTIFHTYLTIHQHDVAMEKDQPWEIVRGTEAPPHRQKGEQEKGRPPGTLRHWNHPQARRTTFLIAIAYFTTSVPCVAAMIVLHFTHPFSISFQTLKGFMKSLALAAFKALGQPCVA
ncbi:hypothetical protein EDC27_1429 [Desulfosoma caldarium]|uniref:Uncharacterized protein n=1 Tax=Desulfosoma caldarium TaxID=610254 RepID=A0A3N1UQM1_9BACT|nr:hypothetical protein EDC27_1429 [Desulfosoma caldarium]